MPSQVDARVQQGYRATVPTYRPSQPRLAHEQRNKRGTAFSCPNVALESLVADSRRFHNDMVVGKHSLIIDLVRLLELSQDESKIEGRFGFRHGPGARPMVGKDWIPSHWGSYNDVPCPPVRRREPTFYRGECGISRMPCNKVGTVTKIPANGGGLQEFAKV